MAYDEESDRIVVFGGNTGSSALTIRNDTWAYDFNKNGWTNLSPATAPAPRRNAELAYDVESDRIVVFGGERAGYSPNDTWAYDFNANTWTNLNPPTSPAPRVGHSMAYDARSDRIVLFGGASSGTFVGDTWAYDFNANTWTNMSPSSGPLGRALHSVAYDAESERIVLFGGFSLDLVPTNDTWAYDVYANRWRNLSPPTSPARRLGHAMAYDRESDRIVLFGGDVDNLVSDAETWTYDLNANAWVEIHPAIAPSPRSGHSMAYDAESHHIVMFGGRVDGAADPAETWSYRSRGPSANDSLLFVLGSVGATALALIVLSLWYLRKKGKKSRRQRADRGAG